MRKVYAKPVRPLRLVWRAMLDRCYNPARTNYKHYGARGIEVCQRWRDSFEAFCEDMGVKPGSWHSLDRIDNDGNYEPGNCRWAAPEVQQNNKRNTRLATFNGKTQTMSQWCRELRVSKGTMHYRISSGLPLTGVYRRKRKPRRVEDKFLEDVK